MKRPITTTIIAVSLLLSFALWSAGRQVTARAAHAAPLMNTLTVTNTNDAGAGSLRQAIANAASGDTINLAVISGTITLTSGELVIDKDLTIFGPGSNQLTISGNNASRVLFINPGAPGATTGPPATNLVVSISNLTIANGRAKGGDGGSANRYGTGGGAAGLGGGVFVNRGALSLAGIVFNNHQAVGGNGGNPFSVNGSSTYGGGGGTGGDGGPFNNPFGGSGGSLGGNATSANVNGGEGAGGGGGSTLF